MHHFFKFGNAQKTNFALCQNQFQACETLFGSARDRKHRDKFFDGFLAESSFLKFFFDVFQSDFVNFVNSYGYVGEALRLADDFGYAGKNLAVV